MQTLSQAQGRASGAVGFKRALVKTFMCELKFNPESTLLTSEGRIFTG
jgi:hypothetical protein